MIEKIKNRIGLTIILVSFGLVELSNFESLFFKFMMAFRPEWGAANHIPGTFLAFALLAVIIIYGLRREKYISWGAAILAIIVSLGVYSQIESIEWQWGKWGMENLAVIILSVICPIMVAHSTHQLAKEPDEDEVDEFAIEANIRRQQRKLMSRKSPQPQSDVMKNQTAPPPPPYNVNGIKKPTYEFDVENFQ